MLLLIKKGSSNPLIDIIYSIVESNVSIFVLPSNEFLPKESI